MVGKWLVGRLDVKEVGGCGGKMGRISFGWFRRGGGGTRNMYLICAFTECFCFSVTISRKNFIGGVVVIAGVGAVIVYFIGFNKLEVLCNEKFKICFLIDE